MNIKIIQNIIDKIRNKEKYKELFSFIYEYCLKITALRMNKNNFHTLVLGSSHIMVGFIPEKREYNCATSSQDLYMGYQIYKYANHEKLKNIIISYSDFSSYNNNLFSPYSQLSLLLKILLGIEYENKKAAKRKISLLDKIYLKKKILKISNNFVSKGINNINLKSYNGKYLFYPNTQYEQNIENEKLMFSYGIKGKKRILISQNYMDEYLLKLVQEAKMYNQKVYIVITPIIEKFYKDLQLEQNKIFKILYTIAKYYDNVKILNFYDDNRFEDNDFYDWQHLNYKWAQKLTSLINQEVNDYEII